MLYRCTSKNKCGQRRALRQPIEKYKRRPRCTACGGNLKLDAARHRARLRETCRCDKMPYAHRRGSTVLCRHYKGPIDEEIYRDAFEAVMRRGK